MKLSEFSKTLRENAAAIITATIVFLLVGNYLIFVIPHNEQKIDDYNKSTLEEFNNQLNNTLKDYASQIDLVNFKNSIAEKADTLNRNWIASSDEVTTKALLEDLKDKEGVILSDLKDNIIICSTNIDSIQNEASQLKIIKHIQFKFSAYINDTFKLCKDSKVLSELFTINDTTCVSKSELKKRLSGAIVFPNWVIYSPENNKTLINNNVDLQEFDSIQKSPSKFGILTFQFSDKRFYRKSAAIDGTDFNVVLIGATSQKDFEAKARLVDVNVSTFWILIVVVLFLTIPLIKPLISSAKEKLTQLDLLNTTSGVGILAIVITSFVFSNYFSNCYKKTVKKEISILNQTVSDKFIKEFRTYNEGLDSVKTILKKESSKEKIMHVDLAQLGYLNRHKALSKNLQNYFKFNSDGDIVKDICAKSNFVIRKNFSERAYFKLLKSTPYTFMFTGVYSKYDNKYKLVYIKKDSLNSLLGFAYSPTFSESIKTDGNTGFMLCNKEGRVILHSDKSKSLNENIYLNSQKPTALLKIFHGIKNDTTFELNYNGNQCLFNAQRITNVSSYPIFLLTYKNLSFTNALKTYTMVNGFALSLAYVLGITFLVLLYSVFFYLGNIPIFSRYHVYWLFPDNSRKTEYKFLKTINYSVFVGFLILFLIGNKDILYFSMLTGINLAFFNFVLLNQRVFILGESSEKRNKHVLRLISTVLIPGYVIPFILYHYQFPAFGLSLSLLSHLIYLSIFKKRTDKDGIPENITRSEESKRYQFTSFFSSVICYHYLLVPAIILLGLFSNEVNKIADFNYSYELKTENAELAKDYIDEANYARPNESFLNSLPFFPPPSNNQLENIDFDTYTSKHSDIGFSNFVFDKNNIRQTFLLIISLILLVVLIGRCINFYSGRFFFFELTEAYRLGYFTNTSKFTNFKIILPPFNNDDLENLEKHERFSDDENNENKQSVWLEAISSRIVPNTVKLDLIMNDNFITYKAAYQEAWDQLTDEEKFVMSDFAADHFVNYKNRNVLIKLMEKGFIIADPLTGRLRVMNYGFRNFVSHIVENTPETDIINIENKIKGTFSRWKLPIMIVAVSGLLLMMYLNKESLNHILFVGGSIVSAIGLIAKFMDTYKQ